MGAALGDRGKPNGCKKIRETAMTDNTQKAPSICDGIEQDAFEAWATENRYDMNTHPLHWLFLNERSAAARDGWKAGLVHAAERCAALSTGQQKGPSQ